MMTRTKACGLSLAALLLALGACTAGQDQLDVDGGAAPALEPAVTPVEGQLLIEEVYYSGASPNQGADHYFSDQFVELVNASDVPLDLSGVMVGDTYGTAGAINPGSSPNSYANSRPNDVVLDSVWRIPDGTRLEPGEHFVLAHDGTNHRPFSDIDLSGSHLEAFVAASARDIDYPTVANAESVLFNGGFDWLVPVFGASLVVISADAPSESIAGPFGDLFAFPTDAVLDGVDALMDLDSAAFKRLPESVDRGYGSASGTYVGLSLHRRETEDGWQDTNDSSADFVVGFPAPTPRAVDLLPGEGDSFVELGTGVTGFEALAEGGDIELVAGFQGGWHVDAAVRFGGFSPTGVTLFYEALAPNAEPLSLITSAGLSPSRVIVDDGAFVRVGDRVVFRVDDGNTLIGQTIVLRVVAEVDGATIADERELVVVDRE